MVKCLTRGLRGFNGAVQRRLGTLTVTILISSCWQLSSKVELRRILDVCKRWANLGSHQFVKKNMFRYIRPHGRFAHCSCKNAALTLMLHFYTCSAPTARFGLLYRNILFRLPQKFPLIFSFPNFMKNSGRLKIIRGNLRSDGQKLVININTTYNNNRSIKIS